MLNIQIKYHIMMSKLFIDDTDKWRYHCKKALDLMNRKLDKIMKELA